MDELNLAVGEYREATAAELLKACSAFPATAAVRDLRAAADGEAIAKEKEKEKSITSTKKIGKAESGVEPEGASLETPPAKKRIVAVEGSSSSNISSSDGGDGSGAGSSAVAAASRKTTSGD